MTDEKTTGKEQETGQEVYLTNDQARDLVSRIADQKGRAIAIVKLCDAQARREQRGLPSISIPYEIAELSIDILLQEGKEKDAIWVISRTQGKEKAKEAAIPAIERLLKEKRYFDAKLTAAYVGLDDEVELRVSLIKEEYIQAAQQIKMVEEARADTLLLQAGFSDRESFYMRAILEAANKEREIPLEKVLGLVSDSGLVDYAIGVYREHKNRDIALEIARAYGNDAEIHDLEKKVKKEKIQELQQDFKKHRKEMEGIEEYLANHNEADDPEGNDFFRSVRYSGLARHLCEDCLLAESLGQEEIRKDVKECLLGLLRPFENALLHNSLVFD